MNNPEKESKTGICKVSSGLMARIQTLPKTSDRIVGVSSVKSMTTMLCRVKRKAAPSLNNPRLLQIHFHTIRHWKATIEYHKTKDLLHVQQFLRHKDVKATMIYVHLENTLFNENSNEFHVKTAKTLEEACELVKVGFEYVMEIDGIKILRKRK